MAQRLRILLDHLAAARRIDHEGLDHAAGHHRPPRIDVAAHVGQTAVPIGQMRAQSAATTLVRGEQRLNTRRIEHAPGRAMISRAASPAARSPAAAAPCAVLARLEVAGRGAAVRGHLAAQGGRQQRPQQPADPHRRREQRRSQSLLEKPAGRRAPPAAARPCASTRCAADVDQLPVLDAARAGGLAVAGRSGSGPDAAGCCAVTGAAFEHLLDQVDAAARPVELIAEQLIGRAGGVAEAAVHALAQNRFGLARPRACPGIPGSDWFAWRLSKLRVQPPGIEDARPDRRRCFKAR